jgi:hypothetical protein
MRSTLFKAMVEQDRAVSFKGELAKEAVAGLVAGLKFKHSRGVMEDKFRVVIMDALNDESVHTVYGKDGQTWTEPNISPLDKAKLAMDGFKVLNAKASQIVGKQINIDKSQHVTITTVEMLDAPLQELYKAAMMHLPTRHIEHADGTDEFVLDTSQMEAEVEEENEDEEDEDE